MQVIKHIKSTMGRIPVLMTWDHSLIHRTHILILIPIQADIITSSPQMGNQRNRRSNSMLRIKDYNSIDLIRKSYQNYLCIIIVYTLYII